MTEQEIPREILELKTAIGKNLSSEAGGWDVRFNECVRRASAASADLSRIWPQFVIWLLADESDGVIRFADTQGRVAIREAADLYRRKRDGDKPSADEWTAVMAASDAARNASDATWPTWAAAMTAHNAAMAANDTTWVLATITSAATAAITTAWNTAMAANDTASDTTWPAASDAARDATCQKQSDKLIELIENAQ